MSNLSEEAKERIIEEERVRAEARQQFSQSAGASPRRTNSRRQWLMILKVILFFVALYFVIAYWYLAVPALIIGVLWFWKRIKLPKQTKIYISGAVITVFAVITGWTLFTHRAPTVTASEPQDNQSLQAEVVTVKGSVNPKQSSVTINGAATAVGSDGAFQQEVKLMDEQTTITIEATNYDKKSTSTLTVNRIFTEAEKAERERKAQELKAAREKQAQERAVQQAKQAEEDAKKKAEEDEKNDGSVAAICAKNYVKDSLKAPSTADFPWSLGSTVPLGKNQYTVSSYVDAQNGFGAMIRTNYACTITVVDAKNYLCVSECKLGE